MRTDMNIARRIAVVAGTVLLGLSTMAPVAAHGGTQHPVTINAGSCRALDEIVLPLGDAGDQLPVDGEPAASDPVGAETAVQVDGSITSVQLPLADLIAGDYAVVVHASADEIDSGVACGDVGGRMVGENLLPIGLAQVDESGTSGIAVLEDNGDGTTRVSVFVTKESAGDDHDHDDDNGNDDHEHDATPEG